jgi:hypothetical protein
MSVLLGISAQYNYNRIRANALGFGISTEKYVPSSIISASNKFTIVIYDKKTNKPLCSGIIINEKGDFITLLHVV